MSNPASTRRVLVPEVIQTSAMDCGPAALQALLVGHGIAAQYSRLREACQTDVDGTSIDTLEEVAVELGLDAEQYIVPVDHLLREQTEALPAIVVTRQPNGLTHFVVAWRTDFGLTQVMDPATGRVFRTRRQFLRDVFVHRLPVPIELGNEWLRAPAFIDPLRARLAELELPDVQIESMLEPAINTKEWLPLASIDAATRLAARLVEAKALQAGATAASFIDRIAQEATRRGGSQACEVVPEGDWSVVAHGDDAVELRGVVIVHVEGRIEPGDDDDDDGDDDDSDNDGEPQGPSSPELAAALTGDEPRPLRAIFEAGLAEHPGVMLALPLALLLAGAVTAIEAALLTGLTHLDPGLGPGLGATNGGLNAHRIVWMVAVFLGLALLLELSVGAVLLRLGRWLDIHLRTLLLTKLPRLGNHYFHSRLTSDLAHRAHELRSLRRMPKLVGDGLRIACEIVVSAAGIVYLVPDSGAVVAIAAVAVLVVPIAVVPVLREQDLRRETHVSVLIRFHLDALLGLLPIRAHRAERSVRGEHESLLVKWMATTRELNLSYLAILTIAQVGGTLFAVWIIVHALRGSGVPELSLLVAYWALKLPMLSQALLELLRQLPQQQNRLGRLFEVLTGPEETELLADRGAAGHAAQPRPAPSQNQPASATGVHVHMREVGVVAGGQEILAQINLEIRPGEHVAIVGSSGSGKSSLVGLLLGWHRACSGSAWVDGERVHAGSIARLRRVSAWVDPAVALWNRSLADNLRYGNALPSARQINSAIEQAQLSDVVARLPAGVDTPLGEAGSRLSGGEGQRVRFARALLRPDVRLCILDEPFRGLEQDRRHALLGVARERWRDATLLYVSHDIDAALGFARVLVVERGRIVEDGAPDQLLARPDSRLGQLLAAQRAAQAQVWGNPVWRRWWIERGELREIGGDEA